MVPSVAIRPILFAEFSANQSAPSGPAVIPSGPPVAGNSVTTPAGVTRPILLVSSVNQRLPSGPAVRSCGMPPLGSGNSSTLWA